MCSIIISRKNMSKWPVILAANRDELKTRKSSPPARHWRDRPDVIGGLDQLAGGSWLADLLAGCQSTGWGRLDGWLGLVSWMVEAA